MEKVVLIISTDLRIQVFLLDHIQIQVVHQSIDQHQLRQEIFHQVQFQVQHVVQAVLVLQLGEAVHRHLDHPEVVVQGKCDI